MMKIFICPICGFTAITSRRTECECRKCTREMLKAPVTIDEWWGWGSDQRESFVESFLESACTKAPPEDTTDGCF